MIFFYLNVYTCTATCLIFREITNKICSCWTKQTQWGNFEYIMSNYSKQMTKLDGARANKLYICQWCNSQHSNHQSTKSSRSTNYEYWKQKKTSYDSAT